MTCRFQFFSQVLVIINLSIKYKNHAAILIVQRLITNGRKIYDTQTAKSECCIFIHILSRTIRSPVYDCIHHINKYLFSVINFSDKSCKSTHMPSPFLITVNCIFVNSNVYLHPTINFFYYSLFYSGKKVPFIRKTEKYCEYNITVSPLIVYLIVMVSPSTRILYLIYREK